MYKVLIICTTYSIRYPQIPNQISQILDSIVVIVCYLEAL